MLTVLLASHNGLLYDVDITTIDDIRNLVGDQRVETLTSSDGRIDFWFTPSTRPAHQRPNRLATQLVLVTTTFSARTVPLLGGTVVIASHDAHGTLIGLGAAERQQLAAVNRIGNLAELMLDRRLTQRQCALLRQARSQRAAKTPIRS